MRRLTVFLLIAAGCMGIGWSAYQSAAPSEPQLSRYAPAGALLYLQTKDFGSLLTEWNASAERLAWLKSSNYEVFSRSRLFLRLKGASDQFAAAAGLPPDMSFLGQVAGTRGALALYDIGKLQFLYITRLPSANSMQTALWQTRSTFETRSAGGTTFFLRKDSGSDREVEFAIKDDYLLLATREDLLAGALQLMAESKDRTIEDESWWAPVSAAGPAGDLRMVLNLEKIVPSPYFRSYWVQQNITDTKQYTAAVSDLFRSPTEYREERLLLRKISSSDSDASPDGAQAVADLARLVPEDAGMYEVKADPSVDACFNLLETKILAPHLGAAPPPQTAPQVQLTSGQTGESTDLETRIDQAPVQRVAAEGRSELKELLQQNHVRATLQVQSAERDGDDVFIGIHSAVAVLGSSDWDDASVRKAVVAFIQPDLTASLLGLGWQQKNGYEELDGLQTLTVASRGKYLLISDDPALMTSMLARTNQKSDAPPAVFVGGFDHRRERENFVRFFSLVDRPNMIPGQTPGMAQQPQFFSENIASLSTTLTGVSLEKVVVRNAGDKVLQTVIYKWAQ